MDDEVTREPNFLIVGAPKAGTTSLTSYLSQHPDVFMAPEKEIRFFDRDFVYERGWDWYCAQFAEAAAATAIGEASPTYLSNPAALERIARHLPHVRLVAILRHPVERAYSHYWHVRGYGAEQRSFEEALADASAEHRYLSPGRYAQHLKRAKRLFPPEHVRVILFDDFTADPSAVMDDLCRWLGLGPLEITAAEDVHNQRFRLRSPTLRRLMVTGRVWRRAPRLAALLERANRAPVGAAPMQPKTRAALLAEFAPTNDELAAMLGRDLSAWNR
ncbi:MAG: sulfotransferase family protein [Actinomycetes bacterium]